LRSNLIARNRYALTTLLDLHFVAFFYRLDFDKVGGLVVAVIPGRLETRTAKLRGDIFCGQIEASRGRCTALEHVGRDERKMTAQRAGGNLTEHRLRSGCHGRGRKYSRRPYGWGTGRCRGNLLRHKRAETEQDDGQKRLCGIPEKLNAADLRVVFSG